MDVADAVVEDYFDAFPVPDGVLVRMADNVEATVARHVADLVRFLADGAVAERGLVRWGAAARAERRVFPDVYRDRADADDFRARHRERLRDTAPALRVAERCLAGSPFVLAPSEVGEWISVLGQLRLLRAPRGGRTVDGSWYTHMQDRLVRAADPAPAGWA